MKYSKSGVISQCSMELFFMCVCVCGGGGGGSYAACAVTHTVSSLEITFKTGTGECIIIIFMSNFCLLLINEHVRILKANDCFSCNK